MILILHVVEFSFTKKRDTKTSNCPEKYTGLEKKKNNLSSQENLLDLDDTGYSIDSI